MTRSMLSRRRVRRVASGPAGGPFGRRCEIEELEPRRLLAVTVDRTTLNLRFSVDLKPNESAYGEYQAFQITNTGPTALSNVWVRATNFSPTQKVQLGPGEDGLYYIGDLGVSAANAETAFIYMVAQQLTDPLVLDPQPFTIEVWQGVPGAGTLLTSKNDQFEWVGEANKNDSSSVTSSVAVAYSYDGVATPTPIVGGTMTMTVTGDVKNKPDRILFSPATTLGWPADAFVLEDAVITYSKDPQLPPDVIFEKPIPPASTPKDFTAVYTFRIAAPTSTPTPVTPMQYTANGQQVPMNRKFEHSPLFEGIADIPPAEIATDLAITKTGATTVVRGSGTTYSYEITVTSTGSYASQGVVVTDTWPSVFTRATISPPPGTTVTPTGTGFTWTIGTLAAGATTRLTVNFTVPAATPLGSYVNTAVVASTTPDIGPDTAQITTVVTAAAPTADLEIEKRDFVQQYAPGETLTWRITVTNRGPTAVTGARVQDAFPPQVSGVNWTAVFTNGTGTTAGSGNINELVSLASGGTAVYTVVATTFSTATGTLTNTATVAAPAGVTDPNTANNIWTDVDLYAPRADLAITKVDGTPSYVPGEDTVYTVTVTNNGPSFVAGATVVDAFAAAFTGVTWTAVFSGSGSSGNTSGSGSINQSINLAAGGTAVYTIRARVNPAFTSSITNTATVTVPAGTTDPNLANNAATDTNTAAPRVNLAITKTDGTGTYVPGRTTTYTVTVANAGPSFLTGGTLVDVLPAAVVGGTWTAAYTGAGSGGATSGSGDINAGFNLSVGGTAIFTITAPVRSTATGDLVNTATVVMPAGTTNTGASSATDTDTLAGVADLRVAKTDGTTQYVPGTTTTYTLTVSNFGPSAVFGGRLQDTFDATRIDVAGVTWTALFPDGSTRSGTGNIDETFDLEYGAAERVIVFTVTAPILATASGLLSNTATVAVPAGVTDPNLTNNTATDVDALTPYADLQIVKRNLVQTYTPGGTTTYTITVTNASPITVTAARVQDAFPAQIGIANWTAVFTNGSGTASGSGAIDELVTLGPNGTAVYTVVASILSTATGPLENTATVAPPAGIDDLNLSNNTWTDVDLPAPRADLRIRKTNGSTTYVPGAATVYTIVVTNDGPSFVTGARVTDTFAETFSSIAWTAVFAGTGSTGSPSGSGSIDEFVNLAVGGTATYTVTAMVSPSATVDIVNTATVTAPDGTTDPDLTNNSWTDTNTATPRVFLGITKTDGTGTYVPGETLEYTITVTNSGPSFLHGGTLADLLPTGIVGATWSAAYLGQGSTGDTSGSGNIAATFDLAVGGTATFTVLAPVIATATGSLVNTATVGVPAGTTNTNPVNFATDTDLVTPVSDLRALKTDPTTQYEPGTVKTYTITVSNFGPSAVFGARVTDTFDPTNYDVAGVRWRAVFPDGSIRTGSGNIDETFDLERGNAERVIVFTVEAPVLATARGLLSNTASVAVPAGWTDYNLTNNTSTDVCTPLVTGNAVVLAPDDGCNDQPLVRVLDPDTGRPITEFFAYDPRFRGGVRLAVGDVNGDGTDEIVTAPGRGRVGEIRVFTQSGEELSQYRTLPFGAGWQNGVDVALGDIDGDGHLDIVTSMTLGLGTVRAFRVDPSLNDPVIDRPLRSFTPSSGGYRGGVTVEAADFGTFVNGRKISSVPDGKSEIVVGPNAGTAAVVRVYDVSGAARAVAAMQPFGRGFAGGVTLAIGRYDADAVPDILVGAGINGRSVVSIQSGSTFREQARLAAFSRFARPNAKVYAAAYDADGDGVLDRVYATQGQNGSGGTPGTTYWDRSSGTTTLLPLSTAILPPLTVAALPKRTTR